MSKRIMIAFSLLIPLLVSVISTNTTAATNSGQNSIGLVQRIYLNDSTYFFRLQGIDTCSKNTGGFNEYYVFSATSPGAKQYYALILSAAISKKPITIRVRTDCSLNGNKEIVYIFQDF